MKKDRSQEIGISNLRELGGYRARDGARVRKNLLYRSGTPGLPAGQLAQELGPLGISMVFDLRSSQEVKDDPYSLPEGIQYKHRPILASFEENGRMEGLEVPDIESMRQQPGSRPFSREQLSFLDGFMVRVYREMGESAKVFGDIMKEIAENGRNPVLFHCSAGKDRTGVLASLILLTLGVSMEDAMEDYLLSNAYRQEEIDKEMEKIAALIEDPVILDQIRGMLLVKEEYMEAALQPVKAYPGFGDYARDRLGLNPEDMQRLRALYLE